MDQGTQAFQQSYIQRGRPRMALLVNRVLSDSVLEWTVEHGVTFDAEGAPRNYEVRRRNPLLGAQRDLELAWVWSFEDGFSTRLRQAGAQLVDRSTIMRAVAAEDGGTGEPERPLSVRQVEMDALKQHAEVMIELLVESDPDAGFIMRARAIEVPSGVVLASATSNGLRPTIEPLPVLRAEALSAGPTGYRVVTITHDPNPTAAPAPSFRDPRTAASILAERLAADLAASWAR